jgi:hypothetical protein
MKYFVIEPEVAGGLGPNTTMERSVHPPLVSRLHYQFDGWLGDAVLESFPCFIVTEEVRRTLKRLGATGFEFGEVEITKSEQFHELLPDCQLPQFFWLRISGRPGHEDVGITADARLVVSERVFRALSDVGISHARVSEFVAGRE